MHTSVAVISPSVDHQEVKTVFRIERLDEERDIVMVALRVIELHGYPAAHVVVVVVRVAGALYPTRTRREKRTRTHSCERTTKLSTYHNIIA